jgi:WD40 repeat protein
LGDGVIKVVDARSGKATHTLQGGVDVATFSPNGHLLATTGIDGLVKLWDPRTWAQVGSAVQDSSGVGLSLSFDPTGHLLVTGASDSTVRLFDLSNPTRVTSFGPPSFPTITGGDWITAEFTSDGSAIVAVDASGQAWVWPMRWQDWAGHACVAAGRQLSRAEWSQYVGGRTFAPVCHDTGTELSAQSG